MLTPRLKTRGGIPYGGEYRIDRPDLGMVGSGTTFDMLMTNIRKWRFANGFQNGLGLDDEVETQICKLYSAECHETDERVPQRESLDVAAVIQGTKVMVRHQLSGLPLVAPEEANRRAAICSSCPNNMDFRKPCSGICGELKTIVDTLINHRTTTSHDALKSCQVCGCYLTASVWIPLETQQADLSEAQRAQFRYAATHGCWKGQGL